MISAISQRMLTLTLRHLERDGLITRELFPEVPPRVEYQLTALGKSLLVPTQALLEWVGNNWSDIRKARGRFDERRPR
jgi:DNA-binding HxlR family transcriptional regulator